MVGKGKSSQCIYGEGRTEEVELHCDIGKSFAGRVVIESRKTERFSEHNVIFSMAFVEQRVKVKEKKNTCFLFMC